jgi:hypothetical protein
MPSDQYLERINQARYMHQHPLGVPSPDGRTWGDGLGIVRIAPWLRDLVRLHGANSILEVGAGRGQQLEPRVWDQGTAEEYHGTITQWLGLEQYHMYDPAISGIDQWPDSEFDCVVAMGVLNSIPDSDFSWWLQEISQRTKKFCLLCGGIAYATTTIQPIDYMNMDPVLLDYHSIIGSVDDERDEDFYRSMFAQYWSGAALYFLPLAQLPVMAGWHDEALVSG